MVAADRCLEQDICGGDVPGGDQKVAQQMIKWTLLKEEWTRNPSPSKREKYMFLFLFFVFNKLIIYYIREQNLRTRKKQSYHEDLGVQRHCLCTRPLPAFCLSG